MPIRPQDKARILAEIGVDPKKYWMDDEGEIIDMPEQGTAETAIKTTLHNAPRTALGFVGSALGAAGAGALATPETAGLATIPAALAGGAAGGMAGGFAGQELQEAAYPESWRLAEEARSVRAPITTKVADVAASMALVRPSWSVTKAALGAPAEFMRTAGQLQPKRIEALTNVGFGAGMGGGMAAAQGASPGEVALETALGALQVQPTWLGTKMSGGLFRPFTTEGLAEPGGLPTAEAQARFASALEAQNAPPQPAIAPDALAELVAKFTKQRAADAKRIQEGVIAGEGARQNEAQRQKRAVVEAALGIQSEEGKTVLPADIRSVDERLAATGGAPEQQMKLTPAVQQAQEAKLRGASPVEQELAMLLSPEQHKYFRDIFKKFDTEYRDAPELDASGRFVPRESAAKPSRTDIGGRAYLDVYPHEALHALLSDTLNYGTARERAFTERALRELGIEVLTDGNGRKSLARDSEEALAKQVGEESIRVLAGKQKPAPVREAFSDFVDYLINDKLTPDVARRILRDRTVFGAGTRGIVARAARRGGMRAAFGAPPIMPENAEQQPAAQAAAEKPFEPVELPERLAPTRDMTPEQIAQVEAAREAARTPPPAAQAEAVQEQRRADELAARAEQMKTLLDEQEARLRRLESAERTRQRIGALQESPLGSQRRIARRISNLNEFEQRRPSLREEEGSGAMTQEELDQAAAQRFTDTGGEPPAAQESIGEEFLPSDVRGYESSAAMRSMREAAARGERVGPGTDVTRPETVEYTGAPVPANVRAGVRRREAALETPADLEARRIEEQLSGRDRGRDRYQPLLDEEARARNLEALRQADMRRLDIEDVDWDNLKGKKSVSIDDIFDRTAAHSRMHVEKLKLITSSDREILSVEPRAGLLMRDDTFGRAITLGDKNEGTILIDKNLWNDAVGGDIQSRELFLRVLKHEMGHIDDGRDIADRTPDERERIANEFEARYQPLAEDRESLQPDEELQSGAQIRKILELLRNNQDRGNTTEVAGRELIQNAVDAIYKNSGGNGTVWSSAQTLPNDESRVSLLDDAGGMSPQFMLTKYISMGYSTKMVGEAGGFGIAKGQFLGKALEFRVNSQYTDKNGDTYLTQLVGTGNGFMAMQEPRKFKYPIGEWVTPVDGFKYRIDKIDRPKTADGTLVSARYPKNRSSSWEARSIINESLGYHKNIKTGYLTDSDFYVEENKGTVLEGTGFNPGNEDQRKPEYNTLGDIKTTNADIAVFVEADAKPVPSRVIFYKVLSNGIHQFNGHVSVSSEILAPNFIFNVKPTGLGSSESYPFTPDRSSLKGPEAQAIENYIGTFEEAERKRRLAKYGRATQDAPKLQQAGLENLSILDVTEQLPPDFVRDVQTNPTFGIAARAIRDVNTVVNDVLTRRFPKENYKRGLLKGFFVGTADAYGVRFGSQDPTSVGDIYYDPTLLFDKAISDTKNQGGNEADVDEVMSRWLGQTIGVALHENLHQNIHSEGEELARELTFTAGELALASDLVFAKLGKTIDSIIGNTELYNTLKDYNEKAKVYRSSQKNNEFISGVQGTFRSSDERYQPLGPERGEYKGAKLPERERRVFGRGIFAGNIEALRRTGDPQKVEFAGAMEELYARIRNYTGQYEEGIIRPLTDLSKASQQKVVEALYDESMAGKPATAGLSPDELAAHREIRAGLVKMRNDQIAANHLIEGKPAGRDPFYFPHVVDSSIIHDLSNSPESSRAKEAERQFIDFNAELFRNKGIAPAVAMKRATEAFGKFIGSLKPISVDSGFDYGAVSMPAGTKLPPTWVAADPVDGFRSYIKRFSRARAFYDVIGRDENSMRQIGRKFYYDAAGKEAAVTNPGSRLQRDPNVRALLENALGITHESQEGITPAIGRLANSLLLGNVATRLTDAATTPFKALAYLPPRYIPGLLTNMRNLRSSIDNAYKTGGVRRGDMMVVREILGAGDRYVKGMDKVAETITKYTGSEALEKGARFLAQNVGEYIYDVNKILADSGDKRAADFLNRVTPKWRTLAREETAQRIARLFQGNYDATNLPIWIANSPAAPFFSMMKWNIEQWNNFKRFAWEPALKGDPYALMATVLGGVAGGIAVGELREKITGKKQRVATAGELNFGFREGDKARASMEAMRKAAFLSQVTGTFGIVGELSLQAIDVASKDKPQGFSWPAYEFVSNVIGKIANAVPAAIERPEDALLITGTAANDLAKDIVAQYRILWNAVDRTKGAGEVAEANRRRDLRMSEKLRGEPIRFSPFIERDYRNERERQFDKARDRQQAVAIAKQLDERARRESATGEEYKEAQRKFRTSRIVGIPSAENNPQQFYRHIQFVRNTQGAEAADQLARDYVMLRTEQKWKSSMFR